MDGVDGVGGAAPLKSAINSALLFPEATPPPLPPPPGPEEEDASPEVYVWLG